MQRFNWKLTIKPNIVALRLLGLWPEGNEGYKKDLYAVYAFTFLNLFINCHNFFQAVNIFFVYTDLEALTAIIFVTITDLLASIKVYYFVRNIKQLKALMAALDTQVFQPRRLDEEHTFYYGPKFWRFIYVVYHFPVIPTLTAWTIYPVMDGSVKDYRLPFSAWYPYNSRISPYYEITYGYQVLCIWFSAFAVINTDSMITALMMFIRAQCDILNDSVKNLGSLSSADYNSNLLQCVHHHRTIISFAKDCNKFFDRIVLGQFFTSALALALTMFQLTIVAPLSSEFYSLIFYTGSMTTEIFLYCWFGNEVEIKLRPVSVSVSVLNSTSYSRKKGFKTPKSDITNEEKNIRILLSSGRVFISFNKKTVLKYF
ncbi:hypothetical protein Zmor_007650 [Zophobas morio]|uniref:Odorant receptor n=1 Tax=Zophobas morio TaxID=2755281 RepID=A0AA38J028_9CUCU|nr:hypothetical protein Zmor_007650 [Zophobas morio]